MTFAAQVATPMPFLAVGSNTGVLYTTIDGTTWYQTGVNVAGTAGMSTGTPGRLILGSTSQTKPVFADFQTSTTVNTQTQTAYQASVCCWCSSLGLFSLVDGADGYSYSSPDGITWSQSTTGWASGAGVVQMIGANGAFVINTQLGASISRSTDGKTYATGGFTAGSVAIGWIAFDGVSTMIASATVSAATGAVSVSTNAGLTWSATGALPTAVGYSLAHGNGRWVAVGVSGNRAAYSTSPTAASWTASTFPATAYSQLTFFNGLFFAFNASTVYYTSPDGITWTSNTAPAVLNNVVGVSCPQW